MSYRDDAILTLENEIKSLEADLDSGQGIGFGDPYECLSEMQRKLYSLKAARDLDLLQQDARRYRCLRDGKVGALGGLIPDGKDLDSICDDAIVAGRECTE